MAGKNSESATFRGGQFLTFLLEKEMFGVPIETVREVMDYQSVTKIPGAEEIFNGVINLRGAVVPVADIRVKFGMARTVLRKGTCIIVVRVKASGEDDRTTVGVMADQVMEVAEIASADIQEAPEIGTGVPSSYLRGIGKRDEHFIMLLDVNTIIGRELQSLANHTAE